MGNVVFARTRARTIRCPRCTGSARAPIRARCRRFQTGRRASSSGLPTRAPRVDVLLAIGSAASSGLVETRALATRGARRQTFWVGARPAFALKPARERAVRDSSLDQLLLALVLACAKL